jgi:hypothetical protein
MKKSHEFVWTDEADAALKDLKRVLSTAPVLAAPDDQEPMFLYMACGDLGLPIRNTRYAYNS